MGILRYASSALSPATNAAKADAVVPPWFVMNVELKLADEVMSKGSMKLADVKPNTKPDKAGNRAFDARSQQSRRDEKPAALP